MAIAIAFVPGFVAEAAAQEQIEFIVRDVTSSVLNNSTISAVRLSDAVRVSDLEQFPVPVQPLGIRRTSSPLLKSMYVTTAVVQALDMHSTLGAFKAGAVEANPLMSGITKNRVAFVAAKAAVAASTMFAARQIAKRSKVGAVITMLAVNSAYAMIVRHNYKLARGR
ncbi:MAG TPA: DUF5658 family protein [Vicinamibacterales bacterium]|nr:DUF5658 family protein [Vicinamibacterales bacterium]